MDRAALNALQRRQLIERARNLGVERPEVMTRDELIDEQLRLSQEEASESRGAGAASVRGWFGVARDLLAGLVEQGLHLPDAAKVIRGDGTQGAPSARRPVATVTLAEIYAAQGHVSRGVSVLQEVLQKEPEHEVARRLLGEFSAKELVSEPPDAPTPTLRTPEIRTENKTVAEPGQASAELRPAAAEPVEAPVAVPLAKPAAAEPQAPANVQAAAEPAQAEPPQTPAEVEPAQTPAELAPAEVAPAKVALAEVAPAELALAEVALAEVAPAAPTLAKSPAVATALGTDSCVLFQCASRLVVSWRLSSESFAHCHSAQPSGSPVARVVTWRHGLPARRSVQDIALTQSTGELLVELDSSDPGVVVRGALGWLTAGDEARFHVVTTAVVAPLSGADVSAAALFRPHVAAPIGDLESRRSAAEALVDSYGSARD